MIRLRGGDKELHDEVLSHMHFFEVADWDTGMVGAPVPRPPLLPPQFSPFVPSLIEAVYPSTGLSGALEALLTPNISAISMQTQMRRPRQRGLYRKGVNAFLPYQHRRRRFGRYQYYSDWVLAIAALFSRCSDVNVIRGERVFLVELPSGNLYGVMEDALYCLSMLPFGYETEHGLQHDLTAPRQPAILEWSRGDGYVSAIANFLAQFPLPDEIAIGISYFFHEYYFWHALDPQLMGLTKRTLYPHGSRILTRTPDMQVKPPLTEKQQELIDRYSRDYFRQKQQQQRVDQRWTKSYLDSPGPPA